RDEGVDRGRSLSQGFGTAFAGGVVTAMPNTRQEPSTFSNRIEIDRERLGRKRAAQAQHAIPRHCLRHLGRTRIAPPPTRTKKPLSPPQIEKRRTRAAG